MPTIKLILIIIGAAIIALSCRKIEPEISEPQITEATDSTFDSVAANLYGADDYGMKQYVMAFLYSGNNDSLSQDSAMSLQQRHMQNIGRMAEDGDLVLAGPFLSNDSLRGIYIFDVTTIEEAEQLTSSDPAIQAGVLRMELKQWYGSAALVPLNGIHETLQKKGITE